MTWTTFTLLAVGTLLLGTVAFISCFALLVHHAISETARARWQRRVDQILALLAPHIVAGDRLRSETALAVQRFGRGPVADVLRRARNEIRGERAVEISAALEEIGEVKRLRKRARSRSISRRTAAVRHLGECGGNGAREALIAALADREWEIRRAARDGLLYDAHEESIDLAMRSYLSEPAQSLGWRRSFYARFALVAPGHLCKLLRKTTLDAEEEKLALEALAYARAAEAIPEARARLSASDPELRASAARFAGKLCDLASTPSLVRLLSDPEWFVRAAAARGLGGLPKTGEALEALGRCLNDGTWWVRANAGRALAEEGESGLEILSKAIAGDDPYARHTALAALAGLRVTRGERRAAVTGKAFLVTAVSAPC